MKNCLKALSLILSFLLMLTAMITVYPSFTLSDGGNAVLTAYAAGPVVSTGKQIKAKWNDLWADYNNGIRENDAWQSGSKINDGQIATVCPSNTVAGSQNQYHYSRNTKANTSYEFYIDLDLGAAYDLAGGADYGTRAYISLGGVYGHGITDEGVIYQSFNPLMINSVTITYSASAPGSSDKGTANVKDSYKKLSTSHEGGFTDDQLYCFYDPSSRSGVRYIRFTMNYYTPDDDGAEKQMRNIMVSEVMANQAEEPGIKYTLKYHPNGGDGENIADSVHNSNGGTITNAKYVKAGSGFKGWSLKRASDGKIMYSADGTSNGAAWYAENGQPEGYVPALYQPGEKVMALTTVNNDVINCTAQWFDHSYTVKFVTEKGSGSMDDITVGSGSSFTLEEGTFMYHGYHVFGYTVQRASDGKTLYWDGYAGNPVWHKEGEQPEDMIKKIYTVGSVLTSLTSVDKDVITCTAVWDTNTCTLRYVSNGGLGSIPDTSVKYGTEGTLSPDAFFRLGYNFAGWNLRRQSDNKYACISADGSQEEWLEKGDIGPSWTYKLYQQGQSVGILSAVNGDIIFCEAQWTPYSITVNFDLKGGSGPFGPAVIEYGSEGKLPVYDGTKKGSSFDGWECGGSIYENGADISSLLLEDGAEFTFSAVWKTEVILGDINCDGEVDAVDATLAVKYDAGMVELADAQLISGDVDGDGDVTAFDATLILRYDAGIIDEF